MSSGNWNWRTDSKIEKRLVQAIAVAKEQSYKVRLCAAGMAELFEKIKPEIPEWIIMNPRDFTEMRKWGQQILDVPPPYQNVGFAGLWKATIVTTRELSRNECIVVTKKNAYRFRCQTR